jgi:hypothetical protein
MTSCKCAVVSVKSLFFQADEKYFLRYVIPQISAELGTKNILSDEISRQTERLKSCSIVASILFLLVHLINLIKKKLILNKLCNLNSEEKLFHRCNDVVPLSDRLDSGFHIKSRVACDFFSSGKTLMRCYRHRIANKP